METECNDPHDSPPPSIPAFVEARNPGRPGMIALPVPEPSDSVADRRRAPRKGPSGGAMPSYFTDVAGIHRDLVKYYRSFGLLDSSTPQVLVRRVLIPNKRNF